MEFTNENLKKLAQHIANQGGMAYCWEDLYNRMIAGYPLPIIVKK